MSILIEPEIRHNFFPALEGKRVLIVGGTHGIGEAVAKMCMTLGAFVTVVGRTRNQKLDCEQYCLDVTEESVEFLMEDQDYIFNNIGMYEKNTILNTKPKVLREVLRTNIETMFRLNQYALWHSPKVVVNMSSRPTLEKYHSWSLYTLTKQAIITITKAAAEESKTKFYAICPSRVDTKFREEYFPGEDKSTRLTPYETAKIIVTLFNGKNPSGQHYWIKKLYGSK